MSLDFKEFEKNLAVNKVYNAWQYVESLRETLGYMSISYEMLLKVHEHRVSTLKSVENEIIHEVMETAKGKIKVSDLEKTNLNIGGYVLDDEIFMKKTTMEFFHYARISMEVLFQIVNAALLGDEAISVEDKGLLKKLLKKLSSRSEFSTLLQYLDDNKNHPLFKYLIAFDNFIKHIKTILITVKNSILIGDTDCFEINAFSYGGVPYTAEKALDKIKEIHDYVLLTIENILEEVQKQVPNCIANGQRVQQIHFRQVFTEKEGKSCLDYMTFFIDVENDLSELPADIKVFPLIVKPNDEIYSFDFKFDKIFIRKKGTEEIGILGCATIKNGLDSNEFYRVFEVKPCDITDYFLYTDTFLQNYSMLNFNIYAMDGTMVFI